MTRARVLVAEDNPRIAGMIATALRLEGYEVTVAHDGESALRLANNGSYDALLTDLRMPGLGADRGAATAVAYGVMVLAASLPGGLVLVVGWLARRRASRPRARGRVISRPEGAADA